MMQDIIVCPPPELLRHGGGWGTPETCYSLLSEATEDPHGTTKELEIRCIAEKFMD